MLKKLSIAAVVAGTVFLTGCAGLDPAKVSARGTEEAVTVKYFPDIARAVALPPSLDTVTAMRFKRHFLREESKCKFDGVVVPWERTWPVPAQGGDRFNQEMLPPEPGKIAGFASVIYQRTCPGKAPEGVLHVGHQGHGLFLHKPLAYSASSVDAHDLMETPKDRHP